MSCTRKSLYILLTYKFFTSFGASLFMPFFSLYFIKLGGTPSVLGIVGSVSSFMLLCLNFLGGYLTDKYGNWLVFGVLLTTTNVFILLYSIAWSWEILFLLILLATLFCFYGPALDSLIASTFREEERAIGYQLLEIARRVVKLLSPLVAGLLISTFGILTGVRIGTVVAGTLGIISGLLVLFFMRGEQINFQSNKASFRFFEGYFNLFKRVSKKLIFIIFLGSMVIFVYTMVSPYLVIYSMDVVKLSGIEYGLILSICNTLVTFVVLPLTGLIVKKIGEIDCIIISSFVLTLSTFLFLTQPSFLGVLFSYVFLETSLNFYRPAIFSFWTRNIKESDRGKFSSLISFIEGTTILASFLGGRLYETNQIFLFIAGVLIGFLTAITLLFLKVLGCIK
ncbi:MAG: MFS transporter [Brevinematia bacterium]